MIQPLLHLIATQPQLLADHAQAYGELVAAESSKALAAWKRQVMLNAVALCCMGVAAVLAGVALMLWAVVPEAHVYAPWALIAVPLPPVAVALWCLAAARAKGEGSAFDSVRRQIKADFVMMRDLSAL
jgi:hypothetical protein